MSIVNSPLSLSLTDAGLFEDLSCDSPVEYPGTVLAGAGCPVTLKEEGLKTVSTVIFQCFPKDKMATCEWNYGNIDLGKSTENQISLHETHQFVVANTDLMILLGKDKASLMDKEFKCTCYSEDGSTSESRSVVIKSPQKEKKEPKIELKGLLRHTHIHTHTYTHIHTHTYTHTNTIPPTHTHPSESHMGHLSCTTHFTHPPSLSLQMWSCWTSQTVPSLTRDQATWRPT